MIINTENNLIDNNRTLEKLKMENLLLKKKNDILEKKSNSLKKDKIETNNNNNIENQIKNLFDNLNIFVKQMPKDFIIKFEENKKKIINLINNNNNLNIINYNKINYRSETSKFHKSNSTENLFIKKEISPLNSSFRCESANHSLKLNDNKKLLDKIDNKKISFNLKKENNNKNEKYKKQIDILNNYVIKLKNKLQNAYKINDELTINLNKKEKINEKIQFENKKNITNLKEKITILKKENKKLEEIKNKEIFIYKENNKNYQEKIKILENNLNSLNNNLNNNNLFNPILTFKQAEEDIGTEMITNLNDNNNNNDNNNINNNDNNNNNNNLKIIKIILKIIINI
jgi:hypothetical protein